jgi:hypothetical protein
VAPELNEKQLRLLTHLEKEDHVATEELLRELGLAPVEFRPVVEPLLEDGLVMTAVPTLGSGRWWITPRGRDALRSRAR